MLACLVALLTFAALRTGQSATLASVTVDDGQNAIIEFVGSPWSINTAFPGGAAFSGILSQRTNCLYFTWVRAFASVATTTLRRNVTCTCSSMEEFAGEGKFITSELNRDWKYVNGVPTAMWRLSSSYYTEVVGRRVVSACVEGVSTTNAIFIDTNSPSVVDTSPGAGATINPCGDLPTITLKGERLGDGSSLPLNTTVTPFGSTWRYNPPIPRQNAPWPAMVVVQYGSICISNSTMPDGTRAPELAACRTNVTLHTTRQISFTAPTAVNSRDVVVRVIEYNGGNSWASRPATFQYSRAEVSQLRPGVHLLGDSTSTLSLQVAGSYFPDPATAAADNWTVAEQEVAITVGGQVCNISAISYCSPSLIDCSVATLPVGNYTVAVNISGHSAKMADGTHMLKVACAAGYFGKPGKACQACPEDAAKCDGYVSTGMSEEEMYPGPKALEGWFDLGAIGAMSECPDQSSIAVKRVFPDDGVCLVRCDPPEACSAANVCAEGYKSSYPEYRCSSCASGYYRKDGLCDNCPALSGTFFALLAVFVVAVLLFGSLLMYLRVDLNVVKRGIDYMQIVSMLGAGRLDWPVAIQETLSAFSIAQINTSLAAPECIAQGYPFIAQFGATQLLPFGLLIFCLLAYVVMESARKCCPRLTRRRKAKAPPSIVSPVSNPISSAGSGLLAAVQTPSAISVQTAPADMDHAQPHAQHTQGSCSQIQESGVVGDQRASTAPSRAKSWKVHGWSKSAMAAASLVFAGMDILYLTLTKTALELYYCAPLDYDDGGVYLQVVFERCDRTNGIRSTLLPYGITALILYTVLYPIVVAAILYLYYPEMKEDQILRALGTGDTEATNPRAYRVRRTFSSLYDEFKPGHLYWTLVILGRKLALAVLNLLFNRSASMQMLFVLIVLVGSYIVHAAYKPFIPPIYEDDALQPEHRSQLRKASHLLHVASSRRHMTDQHLRDIGLQPHTPEWSLAIRILKAKGMSLEIVSNVKASKKFDDDAEILLERPKVSQAWDSHQLVLWLTDPNSLESSLLIATIVMCVLGLLHYAISVDGKYYTSLEDVITAFVFLALFLATGQFIVVMCMDFAAQFSFGEPLARWRRLRSVMCDCRRRRKAQRPAAKQLDATVVHVKQHKSYDSSTEGADETDVENNDADVDYNGAGLATGRVDAVGDPQRQEP